MLFGGTNFGFTNDNEMASSYDYGAAIGQGLDLRGLYYRFKRAAWFGQSFASILENSDDASADYAAAADSGTFNISARKAPDGTILFLDNKTKSDALTKIALSNGGEFPDQPITIPAQRFEPFVLDYKLADGIKIVASTPLYGISRNKADLTLLTYGEPGETSQVVFKIDGAARVDSGPLTQKDGCLVYKSQIPPSGAQEADFEVGANHVRIVAVSATMADRTWFVNAGGINYLIGGPDYVGDVDAAQNVLHITTEKFFLPPIPTVDKYFVCGPRGLIDMRPNAPRPIPLRLRPNWETGHRLTPTARRPLNSMIRPGWPAKRPRRWARTATPPLTLGIAPRHQFPSPANTRCASAISGIG